METEEGDGGATEAGSLERLDVVRGELAVMLTLRKKGLGT